MDLWTVLAWLVFGGLAGWIASIVVGKNARMGIVANVIVGILGAVIAGLLLPHDADQFDLGSFVAAVLGAIVLLLVVNAVAGRKPTTRV